MNISIIGTTTHESNSTSWLFVEYLLKFLQGHNVKIINADQLHIVKNLSCYSSGGSNCANPEAGPYRCWAHWNSIKDPEKYGGQDQMPTIYKAISWSDVVIFATSVRWGSHTALMQKIIERMNNLENRVTVYKEPSPLMGKRAGVIVTGQHWKAQSVGAHLLEVLGFMGFNVNLESQLIWQNTWDMNREQTDDNTKSIVLDMSLVAQAPILKFIEEGLGITI